MHSPSEHCDDDACRECVSACRTCRLFQPRAIDQGGSGVDIWWWAHGPDTDWTGRKCARKLVPDERARAASFHFEKDARAFMAGRYLQRSVLSNLYGRANCRSEHRRWTARQTASRRAVRRNCLQFVQHGRVRCLRDQPGRRGSWVSTSKPLGTVIEPETASLFCSAAELEILSVLRGQARQSRLLSYWTLKESYLKATGTGLTSSAGTAEHSAGSRRRMLFAWITACRAAMAPMWHHRLFPRTFRSFDRCFSAVGWEQELLFRQRELPDPV